MFSGESIGSKYSWDRAAPAAADFRAKIGPCGLSADVCSNDRVPDIGKALDLYVSIGFEEYRRVPEDGSANRGMAAFGKAELMFMPGEPGKDEVRLWFYTDKVDELCTILKSRQLEGVSAGAKIDQ